MVRFSVVVPAYNAALTLAETLDAVRSQSFADWECVVVDDGSLDATAGIASAYADRDPRIRTITQDNAGTGGAYNTGVRNAVGEYVVLCSADDILLSGHLGRMHAVISDHPECDIFTANGYLWTPEGDIRSLNYRPGSVKESWTLVDLIAECFYSVGAVYRRKLYDAVGGYRADAFGEDYDFWLRALARGACHRYVDEPLSLHRVSAGQKSADIVRAYLSDVRLVRDLGASFDLSEEERAAVSRRVSAARAIVRDIRREMLLHKLRLLRGSDAPWLRPVRRFYQTLKRLRR